MKLPKLFKKEKNSNNPQVLKVMSIQNYTPMRDRNLESISRTILCEDLDSLRRVLEMNTHQDMKIYETVSTINSPQYIVDFMDGYSHIGTNTRLYKNLLDNIYKTEEALLIHSKLNFRDEDETFVSITDSGQVVVSTIVERFPLTSKISRYRDYQFVSDIDGSYDHLAKFKQFCVKYNLK